MLSSQKKLNIRGLSPKFDVSLKALDKEFKSGWFKKNANFLIDTIDSLLSDQAFSFATIRISLLLLANIYTLSKSQVKAYVKKKSTLEKFQNYFELLLPEHLTDTQTPVYKGEIDEIS